MNQNDTATAANAFYALVDEEMAKTKCNLDTAVRAVRANSPKLHAAAWVDTAKPLEKFAEEWNQQLTAKIENEMLASKCDARTALDRVSRREPELARKAFGG